ncbi:MAG: helix-turn-helix transcriptional regulator [Candidatus Hodarchaeales archaeon]|jgi:predicted ArsR family transcriptional regulator
MSQKQIEGYITKRGRILRYLLLNCSSSERGCTLKEIASAVLLSPTGTRHYMTILENEGLISHSEMQGKAGRPAMTYFLTNNGLNSFPKAYTDFSISLLEEIKNQFGLNSFPKAYTDFSISLLEEIKNQFGERVTTELLEKIGQKRAQRVQAKLTETIGMNKSQVSLKKSLKEMVKIFEENGKFPELLEEEEFFILKNHNCLFYDIAKQEPLVCRVTETIMAELTNEMAIKEECIRDGDKACVFRIKK